LIDRFPDDLDPDTVKALCIEDQYQYETKCTDIPDCIHQFRSLQYLRVPNRYIPHLRPDSIPQTVRVLATDGAGAVTFPREISLPNVVRLDDGYAPLRFTPQTFPGLKHIHLQLDAKRTMLPVVRELTKLQTLSIGPNRDGEVFAWVGAKELTVLNLASGTLETLAGIERLRDLTAVGLRSLYRLKNIGALTRLPSLNDVMLTWCANLIAFDPLLRIASLKYLDIFGCKGYRADRYGAALAARKLKGLPLPD
jgi:hypothetical protein